MVNFHNQYNNMEEQVYKIEWQYKEVELVYYLNKIFHKE